MAQGPDLTISALPNITVLSDNDLVAIVNGGVTKNATIAQLRTEFAGPAETLQNQNLVQGLNTVTHALGRPPVQVVLNLVNGTKVYLYTDFDKYYDTSDNPDTKIFLDLPMAFPNATIYLY